MTILDNETLKKIQTLSLQINVPLAGQASGNRKSRSKGSSVEFSDYREYVPGDDFRRIDWNAYGRFNKLFIKLFMEEREAPVQIFLDSSLSMNYGEPDKSLAARRLAAALSYISLAAYDRVHILPWNDRVQGPFGPFRTQAAFMEVVNLLEGLENRGNSCFTEALRKMEWKAGRGISVVITDGLMEEGLSEGLKYLKYRRQEVFLCHILSKQELSPELSGALELIDSETGHRMEVTVSGSLMTAYENNLKHFLTGIREQCKKWGVHYALLPSDMPVDRMVRAIGRGPGPCG